MAAWVRKHETAWLLPPASVVVTGWLSAHTDTRVVAYWLGAVAGVVSYALVLFGLRPASYARTAAAALGAIAGIVATSLLLHSVGRSLLSW